MYPGPHPNLVGKSRPWIGRRLQPRLFSGGWTETGGDCSPATEPPRTSGEAADYQPSRAVTWCLARCSPVWVTSISTRKSATCSMRSSYILEGSRCLYFFHISTRVLILLLKLTHLNRIKVHSSHLYLGCIYSDCCGTLAALASNISPFSIGAVVLAAGTSYPSHQHLERLHVSLKNWNNRVPVVQLPIMCRR